MGTSKFTPDRSRDTSTDANGVSYENGNRHARRILAFAKPKQAKTEIPSKMVKLKKNMWEKGKSKFLGVRLFVEKMVKKKEGKKEDNKGETLVNKELV